MLRIIKRNIENRDCIGFNCKVKKVRHPILSTRNISDCIKDNLGCRFGNLSSFETAASTLTPLSSNGSFADFFND